MGDMAEYYRDFDEEYSYRHGSSIVPKSSGNFIWTTIDGEEIRVDNMTDLHVKNCINAINNGKIFSTNEYEEDRNLWLKIFSEELKRRKIA